MLTSERAEAVLRGLERNQLVVEAEEIEELLALGLAVEADPDDLAILHWLQPVVRELTRREIGDPQVVQSLEAILQQTEKDLTSDWYRMTTAKPERMRREEDRINIKRALGLLRDKTLAQSLSKIVADSRTLAPSASWVCCAELGAEHYALTHKGWRVQRALSVRLGRFRGVPLKTFLHTFEKSEAKMRAFKLEVTTLSQNVGYVKKNREQVVIGLAKTGVPAGHALGAYHAALREVQAPDVAVTCARNTATFGSPAQAAHRLRLAQAALQRAGFPAQPIVMGAAKSLVGFNPPEAGIPRFVEIIRRLEQVFGRSEVLFKYTARLMPAAGSPEELVSRVALAGNLLARMPSRANPHARDHRTASVALASMARTADAMPDLVTRYREVEHQLFLSGLSALANVEADALECVACPGTPAEVVDTVASLVGQLAEGRPPHNGDVAIAVAFAKRFAY